MPLVTCSIYEAAVRSINTIITTLGVCLYNVLAGVSGVIVLFVYCCDAKAYE